MVRNVGRKLKSNKGQALTEFLIIFVLILFLVLAHLQLSFSYVIAHVTRYTAFMSARAHAVSGQSGQYVEDLMGTPSQSKFSFMATPLTKPGEHVVQDDQGAHVRIDYNVQNYVPMLGMPQEQGRANYSVTSPISHEPTAPEVQGTTRGVLDNE